MTTRAILPVLALVFLATAAGCGESVASLREKGVRDFQVGRLHQAKVSFNEVYARKPSDPTSLYYLGRIAHVRGNLGLAEYWYECCLDADPSYDRARLYLHMVRSERAKLEGTP